MMMEQTVCSETLTYKIQMPGNYPEESIQHSEHGESLKSRIALPSLPHVPSCDIEDTLHLYFLSYIVH